MHRRGLSGLGCACLFFACGGNGSSVSGEGSTSSEGSSSGPGTSVTTADTSTGMSASTTLSTESSEGPVDSSSSTGVPTTCGNGELDDGEDCDDSNVVDGDACRADCTFAFEIAWTNLHDGPASATDSASDVWVDADGNVYVAGGESVAGQGANVWLQQYLPDGSAGWTFTYDGMLGDNDYATSLLATDDGDFVLAGNTAGMASFTDILVLRIDGATQAIEWEVIVDGPGSGSESDDFDRAYALAATDDGGIVVAGEAAVDGQESDVWVGRYDAAGTEIWTVTHDADMVDNTARDVLVGAGGEIYVFAQDYADQMSTGKLVVFDADGLEQPAAAQAFDFAVEKARWDADGNFVVTGFGDPANTLFDAITRKYDPDFAMIWEAVYDGSFDFDFPYALHVDDAGNVYVVGYTSRVGQQGNGFIAAYDADGNPLWGDEYNGELDISESWSGVGSDAMGDVVVAGYVPVLGEQDNAFVRKYHPL